MTGYWNQKNVIITGGSSGLGFALAKSLVGKMAQVIIVGRDECRLKQAGEELGLSPEFTVSCDVTKDEDVQRLFERFAESKLDALINAVGQSDRGKVLASSVQDFRNAMEVNFLSVVRCSRQAIPKLLASQGHLVNIGSLAAKTAPRYLGTYPASKFPLSAYSQQLRLELGADGLHVLLVCPGPIQRSDAGTRYDQQASDLPDSARKPGGGAKVKLIDPDELAIRILKACEKGQPELIVPGKAKLLFALSSLFPKLGDAILRRKTT